MSQRENIRLEGLELDHALLKDVHRAYLNVAEGAPQRMIMRAERAAGLSAGLATSYIALMTLRYDAYHALHWTSFLPALWLGASILFYGIFITATGTKQFEARPLVTAETESIRTWRLKSFIEWINRTALRRVWALNTGTSCMTSGIFSMPVPLLLSDKPCLHLVALLPPLVVGVSALLSASGNDNTGKLSVRPAASSEQVSTTRGKTSG